MIELSAAVDSRGLSGRRLWFRFPSEWEEHVCVDGTAFLPVLLQVAMRCGEELRIQAPVDAVLLRGARQAMRIYHRWDRACRMIDIVVADETTGEERGRYAATLFSGGVDSFYTLLKHCSDGSGITPSITHLLSFHGFDSLTNRPDASENRARIVEAVASDFGVRSVIGSSNFRELTEERAPWAMTHGAALASGALALRSAFRVVYVPSSHVYADDLPWGSHPTLDPLWSTPGMTILHDGCEVSRAEKTARIAGSPVALRHLSVCNAPEKSGNCGRCEKCVRTRLSLFLAGALDRAQTLRGVPTAEEVERVLVLNESTAHYTRENLEALRRRGGAEDLERALRRVLRRWSWWRGPIALLRRARANRLLARPTASLIKVGMRLLDHTRAT